MKFPAFAYVRADSEEQALAVLAEAGDEGYLLAGGQSLLPLLAMRLTSPAALIDINRVRELSSVEVVGGELRIGALVRHREVLSSPLVRRHAPALAAAARHIAHPGVRNRGTFGGSLALADPASEFPACAVALGATVLARSAKGERRVRAWDFFQGIYETALRHDELLARVDIPVTTNGERHAFVEFARRHGDYAMAGLVARAKGAAAAPADVTLCFFAVSDRPVLTPRAAAILRDHGFGEHALAAAIDTAREEITFQEGRGTTGALQRHLIGTLIRRAVPGLVGVGPLCEADGE